MKVLLHFLFLIFFSQITFANVTIIPYGSSWRYLDNGTDQGTAWTAVGFNDASWASGNGQLGYGDGDESTVVGYGGNAANKYVTTYFRKNITIGSTATYLDYTLNVKRDDGIIVYIDGTEVYRNNIAAGAFNYLTLATNAADDGNTPQSVTLSLSQLPTGNHTIAVEVHQTTVASTDISFDLELVANESTVISYGGSWKYLDNGTDQGTAWSGTAFNDATWVSGNAELGYGDGDESTLIGYGGNAANKYITSYFRKNITIGNTSAFSDFTMNMVVDDGIIVYIDGVEVYRNNMPAGAVNYLSLATAAYENNALSTTLSLAQLPTGNHTIAVEIHQTAVTSSDVSFNLELKANFAGAVNITRGPYLNMATQNSVHIRWRTSSASNSIVNYGTVDGSFTSTVTDATLTTEHDVTVTGLSADTKYFYSIGNTLPAVQTLKTGTYYYFYTLPLKGVERLSRFWAAGDCGNNTSNQFNVRNSYMQFMGGKHTDGMLLLGDNAYNAGTDAEYQSNFFPQYQDSLLRNVILWPAPGNHDYANNGTRQNDHVIPYYSMFTLPTAGESGGVASGTEAFYSYDFANIHFIALDSYGKESNTYRIWDTLGPQVVWLKNDLATNTQKWIIAYWHHPPYTLGSHTSEGEADLVAIRENFIRILERNGVDLILCGHSHVYERSYLLNGHYGYEASFNLATHAISNSSAKYDNSSNSCPYTKKSPLSLGTVYVVAGSAGQLGGQQTGWPHNAMVYSNNLQGGGLALTIDGNRLDAEWVCNDGVIRDRFTILKDVNKKEIYTTLEGDSVGLVSSWNGAYNWTGGAITKQVKVAPPGIDTDTLTVTDNFNCLRDSFIITKALQLPVELLNFYGQKMTNHQVMLHWTTVTEYRNAYFEVQWSVDGINFNDIGLVNGYGTTNLQHSYPFLHQQPVTGNNYYRLKQVNEDSSFLYSAIIPVNVDSFIQQIPKNKFIYVFPNPSVSGEFNVDYYNPQNITTKIKVYDLIGKLVYTDEWTVFSGISHYLLKLKDLPKGTYLLNVEDEMVKIQK
ncbi:MAG: metallophosphoesterase [Sphingobacteriales bacterium]|nr:metallophosphoesterase [Sphingobacteriales bacterium]